MMKVILYLYDQCRSMVKKGHTISSILETGIFSDVIKIKYDVPNNRLELLDDYYTRIDSALAKII